jgi:hypothetical protein
VAHNPNRKAALLFDLAPAGLFQLAISAYALDEARRNLARKYPGVSATLISCNGVEPAMANLTISVNEQTLKRARMRALEENRSVNAVLARYLEEYAGEDAARRRRQEALEALLEIADAAECRRGSGTWTRDELHE